MNVKNFLVAACALILAVAALPSVARAQGPPYDKVSVNLPYTVTLGDHVLQPGEYVIRQLDSAAGASRVLLVYSDNGMKFETSAITIPTLDNRTPEDTRVVLHHFGQDYYFDKVWIQGKNYGYEFPLPDSVKSRERERMEPANVAATYQSVPAEQPKETAQAAPAPTPAPEAAPAPAAASEAAAPAPEGPAPAPAPAPEAAQNNPPAASEANRMPTTNANWLLMLLGGGVLSGAGFVLRRRS